MMHRWGRGKPVRAEEQQRQSVIQDPQPPAPRVCEAPSATPSKRGCETMMEEERCWTDIELRRG